MDALVAAPRVVHHGSDLPKVLFSSLPIASWAAFLSMDAIVETFRAWFVKKRIDSIISIISIINRHNSSSKKIPGQDQRGQRRPRHWVQIKHHKAIQGKKGHDKANTGLLVWMFGKLKENAIYSSFVVSFFGFKKAVIFWNRLMILTPCGKEDRFGDFLIVLMVTGSTTL